MHAMPSPDLDAAEQFLAANARVLDRRRFQRLFAGGPAGPVRDAIAAYRNEDGGFGHALEPDGRAPGSQPLALETALRTLHEVDEWDDDLVAGACDWLERMAPPEGGATFAAPSIAGWPRAPWMQPGDTPVASTIATGLIAGSLHARGVSHAWLERAGDLMWSRVDALVASGEAPSGPGGAYQLRAVFAFLQHAPDGARAQAALAPAGAILIDGGHVALEPGAGGEVHGPLEFAPLPDSFARELFDAPTIAAHLDHLAGAQLQDGGWTFNWLAWSPAAELEWRGSLTVDALRVLRANGRLAA
jgi:hypothetical protein